MRKGVRGPVPTEAFLPTASCQGVLSDRRGFVRGGGWHPDRGRGWIQASPSRLLVILARTRFAVNYFPPGRGGHVSKSPIQSTHQSVPGRIGVSVQPFKSHVERSLILCWSCGVELGGRKMLNAPPPSPLVPTFICARKWEVKKEDSKSFLSIPVILETTPQHHALPHSSLDNHPTVTRTRQPQPQPHSTSHPNSTPTLSPPPQLPSSTALQGTHLRHKDAPFVLDNPRPGPPPHRGWGDGPFETATSDLFGRRCFHRHGPRHFTNH